MKRWGIIGALDAEITLLLQNMAVEDSREVCGCTYHTGVLCGQNVVLVCCGVGTINAAVCTTVIIREFGADKVINVGIAGSACGELQVMDVVIGDRLLFHDADLDILEKYYPHRRDYPTDQALRELAVHAIESLEDRSFRYKVGAIASGDAYVTDSGRRADIVSRCAPLCIEMEGAAIAQVAFMNRVPCLVLRTLSDNADEDADASYDNFFEKAADNSAHILQQLLRLI